MLHHDVFARVQRLIWSSVLGKVGMVTELLSHLTPTSRYSGGGLGGGGEGGGGQRLKKTFYNSLPSREGWCWEDQDSPV